MKGKLVFRKLAVEAARAADAKKAEEIALYDVGGISSVSYYVLVMSASSPAHMNALSEEIRKVLKKEKAYPAHKEGDGSRFWRVLDFGGLMAHIFDGEAREFYAFDKIFHECGKVRWKKRIPVKKNASRKTGKKA